MGYKKELKQIVADIMATRNNANSIPTPIASSQPEILFRAYINSRHGIHNNGIHNKIQPKIPNFYIMDSAKENYLTIFMERKEIPHFIRKAGMFGIIWEKGLCIPVGKANKNWDALQVHMVTTADCVDIEKPKDELDQFRK